MPVKVRVSFGELRIAALHIIGRVHACRRFLMLNPVVTSWDSWIVRSHRYVEQLIVSEHEVSDSLVERLCGEVPLSRYVGVVRVQADDLDPIHVLLDTTGPERNLNCLAVIQVANSRHNTSSIADFLAKHYHCPTFS
jgi:hypothetical protein